MTAESHPEYDAPDGERWRVELGADLLSAFEIDADALPKWHEAFCAQEPTWMILRRLYAVAPLYGVEDPEDLQPSAAGALAEKLGLKREEIEQRVLEAKSYWRRWWREKEGGRRPEVRGQEVSQKPVPDAETISALLLENGFVGIEDEAERKFIGQRIQDLQPWLENDAMRSSARSLIQQEAIIFFMHDPALAALRARLRQQAARDPKPDMKSELEQLSKLTGARQSAQAALEASMKALGVTEGQGGNLRKKLAVQDWLSALLDAYAEYYSDEKRALIDGVFTAMEVELLLTPLGDLRPAQYRPDLVVSINEAMQHLFEREWEPTPLNRRVCRALKAGFNEGAARARSEDVDVSLTPEEELELASDEAISEEAQPPLPSPGEAKPMMVPPPVSRASREEEVAVIMT